MHGCGPPPGARVNAPQHNRQKRPSGRQQAQPPTGSWLQTTDCRQPRSLALWPQLDPAAAAATARRSRVAVLFQILCPDNVCNNNLSVAESWCWAGVGCGLQQYSRRTLRRICAVARQCRQSCVLIRPAACVQARAPPRVMCPVCYECVCAAEPPPHPDNNTHTQFLQPQLSSEDPHHHASLKHNHPPAALIPQLSSDPGCRLWMFMIMLSVCPAAGVELHFNCSITWSLTFKKNTSLLTHMTHAISTDCQN